MIITVLLTVLVLANLLLLWALVYSGRNARDGAARLGQAFIGLVLVFDLIFAAGGVVLW